jgi:hypothetical protein
VGDAKPTDEDESFFLRNALDEEDLSARQRAWFAQHWPGRRRRFRSENVVAIEAWRKRSLGGKA